MVAGVFGVSACTPTRSGEATASNQPPVPESAASARLAEQAEQWVLPPGMVPEYADLARAAVRVAEGVGLQPSHNLRVEASDGRGIILRADALTHGLAGALTDALDAPDLGLVNVRITRSPSLNAATWDLAAGLTGRQESPGPGMSRIGTPSGGFLDLPQSGKTDDLLDRGIHPTDFGSSPHGSRLHPYEESGRLRLLRAEDAVFYVGKELRLPTIWSRATGLERKLAASRLNGKVWMEELYFGERDMLRLRLAGEGAKRADFEDILRDLPDDWKCAELTDIGAVFTSPANVITFVRQGPMGTIRYWGDAAGRQVEWDTSGQWKPQRPFMWSPDKE